MSETRRMVYRRVGDKGALVRLPRVFPLYQAFRAAFPRSRPRRRAWTFFVPGSAAMRRIGAFEAIHGDAAAREVRVRERARQDAEWEALEREAA